MLTSGHLSPRGWEPGSGAGLVLDCAQTLTNVLRALEEAVVPDLVEGHHGVVLAHLVHDLRPQPPGRVLVTLGGVKVETGAAESVTFFCREGIFSLFFLTFFLLGAQDKTKFWHLSCLELPVNRFKD